MRTEPLLVSLAITVLPSACVTHSIEEDTSAIRAVLATRTELDVVDRDPERWEESEPVVLTLLARPLDVENAVRIALLNNRELRAAFYELGIARGQLVQAGLLPNPTIEAEARFPEDNAQSTQYDIGIAIDLTSMILAPIRAHAAAARIDMVRYQTAGAVLDLAYRVRLAFFRYQASAQQLELLRTSMESLVASVEAARALRDAGNVRDLEVALEEAALEWGRIAVAEAELELVDDREKLNVLLGLHGRDAAWEVAGRLPEPPMEELSAEAIEARAIEASLDLAATRAALEWLGRTLGVARSEGLIPDISVGFHAEFDENRWEYGPELAIGLPMFSFGQGRVQSAQAELESLRERYVGIAIAVRASVRAARNRAVTTEMVARRYRDVLLPARSRVFDETLLLYNAMQIDVFRLLQARREQLDAASSYIEALRAYWSARATLDQVLAGRIAGSVGNREDVNATSSSRRPGQERSAESPH